MSGPNTVTVPLAVPLIHGDDVLTELVLTEPDLGGLQGMDHAAGDVGQTIAMIIACTQLPPSVIKQLRVRDLKSVAEAAAKLMGEESSPTGARQRRGSPIPFTGRQAS